MIVTEVKSSIKAFWTTEQTYCVSARQEPVSIFQRYKSMVCHANLFDTFYTFKDLNTSIEI